MAGCGGAVCCRDGELPLSLDLHAGTSARAIHPGPTADSSSPGQRLSKPTCRRATCWAHPKPGASAAAVGPEILHFYAQRFSWRPGQARRATTLADQSCVGNYLFLSSFSFQSHVWPHLSPSRVCTGPVCDQGSRPSHKGAETSRVTVTWQPRGLPPPSPPPPTCLLLPGCPYCRQGRTRCPSSRGPLLAFSPGRATTGPRQHLQTCFFTVCVSC